MAITPVNHSALTGIERGMQGLQKNAAQIASAGTTTSPGEIAKPLVNNLQSSHQIEASVKVLQAQGDTLGALLDVLA